MRIGSSVRLQLTPPGGAARPGQPLDRGGFNHVLANRYRDGADSMGFHADDEPEFGPDPLIATLSLGASRRFRLAPRRAD